MGQAGLHSSSAYASVPCPPRTRDLTNTLRLGPVADRCIGKGPAVDSEFSDLQPKVRFETGPFQSGSIASTPHQHLQGASEAVRDCCEPQGQRGACRLLRRALGFGEGPGEFNAAQHRS